MGIEQICKDCKYFKEDVSIEGGSALKGKCCRWPPKIFKKGIDVAEYPAVKSNQWCGEWKGGH